MNTGGFVYVFLQTHVYEKNFDASGYSEDHNKPLPIKKQKSYRHDETEGWWKHMTGLIGLRDKVHA